MSKIATSVATATIQPLKLGQRLPPLPTIRDIIKLYKLRAIKQLSQNFLMDERITDRIVKAAGKLEGHHVLEVGPGPGSITRSILRKCPQHLVVIEKDKRFMPTLELLSEATKNQTTMDIYFDDILRYPMEKAFAEIAPGQYDWHGPFAPIHLIGNLPFAISTRLLINWLKDISLKRGAWSYGRSTMVLTFQKEVAERIIAPMMASNRCRLSVMSQIWTKPELRFIISGKSFIPKPDVDVGVMKLTPLKVPLTTVDFDRVEKVMRLLFSMRQKYCQRGISNLYPETVREQLTTETFRLADVNPHARSFQLSNDECVRLIEAYNQIIGKYPDFSTYNYRAEKKLRPKMNTNDEECDLESSDDDDDDGDGEDEKDINGNKIWK